MWKKLGSPCGYVKKLSSSKNSGPEVVNFEPQFPETLEIPCELKLPILDLVAVDHLIYRGLSNLTFDSQASVFDQYD